MLQYVAETGQSPEKNSTYWRSDFPVIETIDRRKRDK